jgi:hypothetical protein
MFPVDIFYFLFPLVEDFYGTRFQSGSFFLINVGSDFHCLRSFFRTCPNSSKHGKEAASSCSSP